MTEVRQRIRASIHEKALQRVNRMYSASLSEIFTEVFQNARARSAFRSASTRGKRAARR